MLINLEKKKQINKVMEKEREIQKLSLVRNDNIFFSLQITSSCFPTFTQNLELCFPKFRELSNVSPNRSTVSTSGKAIPSANSDSLKLGFRETTSALHFFRVQDHLLLRNHSHTTTSSLLRTCSTTAGSVSTKYS